MSNAVGGHGVVLGMELDPTGSPGVFTNVAELFDMTWPEISRGETEVTPHGDTIDSWVLGVLRRSAFTMQLNHIRTNTTHGPVVASALAGMFKAIANGETRGFQLFGPESTGAGVDEWIFSGQVQSVQPGTPVRDGQRMLDVAVRASGPMIIDGVQIGTVAT